jgi:hypothetical protein
MVLKWIEDEFQKGPDKVLVKRLAKVELFCHTSNGKVDLLIHIFFCRSCEYPNGPTLKKREDDHDDHLPIWILRARSLCF